MIAKQSRKQDLLVVSKSFLNEVETLLKKSDEDNLKGVSLHNEKHVILNERLKLILHQFRNHVRLSLKEEVLIEIRNQLLLGGLEISDPKEFEYLEQSDKEVVVSTQDISNIYRLRGEIYFESKH